MTCHVCKKPTRKHGKTKAGRQRFRCTWCETTFTENHHPLGSMRIPQEKALLALQMLVEGSSIRSTERITGIHRDTIMRLLVHAGDRCQSLLDGKMRDLPCRFVEVDEIWTYVKKKKKNLKKHDPWEYGDKFVFIGIDPESKLIPTFVLGDRDKETAIDFMFDLAVRVSQKIQLSTDAFAPFAEAVKISFGSNVHYGQVMKSYVAARPGAARYSPPRIKSIWKSTVTGKPKGRHISTSLVERHNLTIRMQLRRFTRLTNAFSKKFANLKAAVTLYCAHYNFCREHSAIKKTPAMAAGLADHKWTIRELLTEAATLS